MEIVGAHILRPTHLQKNLDEEDEDQNDEDDSHDEKLVEEYAAV